MRLNIPGLLLALGVSVLMWAAVITCVIVGISVVLP